MTERTPPSDESNAEPDPASESVPSDVTVKKETVSSADSDTTSGRARHWLTNDFIAASLLTSFVFVVAGEALGIIDLDVLPPSIQLLYIAVVGGAAVWSFGQGVLELLGP